MKINIQWYGESMFFTFFLFYFFLFQIKNTLDPLPAPTQINYLIRYCTLAYSFVLMNILDIETKIKFILQ